VSAANQPRPDDGPPRYDVSAPMPHPSGPASYPIGQSHPGGPTSHPGGPMSYPGGPPPTSATAPARGRPPVRRIALVWVVSVLVIALLGAPLGLLWRAAAPSVPVVKSDDGAVLAQPEPEQFIAADGWFTLLGAGLGALVAVALWYGLRRYRGPAGAFAVTVGMIGAAVLAWRLGREVGLSDYQQVAAAAQIGAHLDKPPDLLAGGVSWFGGVVPVLWGVLLAPAFGAAVTYTMLAAWARSPSLRPEPNGVSSDWPGPPARTAEPGPPAPPAGEPPRG
jgi:hypothetical protein